MKKYVVVGRDYYYFDTYAEFESYINNCDLDDLHRIDYASYDIVTDDEDMETLEVIEDLMNEVEDAIYEYGSGEKEREYLEWEYWQSQRFW